MDRRLAILAVLAATSLVPACRSTDPHASDGRRIFRVGYMPNVTHAPVLWGLESGAFGAALGPGGRLAIVDMDSTYGEQEWRGEFLTLIRAFSPLTHYESETQVVRALETSGHFVREGEAAAAPVTLEQSVDDYMAMLASTSSLSRTTLGPRADEFDRQARAIFARHGMTGVRAEVVSGVTWGRPR